MCCPCIHCGKCADRQGRCVACYEKLPDPAARRCPACGAVQPPPPGERLRGAKRTGTHGS